MLCYGILGSFEHSKWEGAYEELQHRRSCLGWGGAQADTQSSGAHVAQTRGPVSPGSLLRLPLSPWLSLFGVFMAQTPSFSIFCDGCEWCVLICVYESFPVHDVGDRLVGFCMRRRGDAIFLGSGLCWPTAPVQALAR